MTLRSEYSLMIRYLARRDRNTSRRRFFLAKDYHDKNEMEFEKHHTEKIWVDMLTKPKQGTPFRRDRSILMNVNIDYDDKLERKNTDPRLLPNPDKEMPCIPIPHPNPTIERSSTSNCCRSVLGFSMMNSKSGPSQVEPKSNKTRNNKIPVTKSNHVSQVYWADIARTVCLGSRNIFFSISFFMPCLACYWKVRVRDFYCPKMSL